MNERLINMMGGDQGALPAPDWPCPRCGKETEADYECQTWLKNGVRMSCMPCDTAFRVSCIDCEWEYVWGKTYPANEGMEKPSWGRERCEIEWFTPQEED